MITTVNRIEIQNAFLSVSRQSFLEKRRPIAEEEINEVKKYIKVSIKFIDSVTLYFEKLTWIDGLDEDCLISVNNIISATKDLHSSLIKQYESLKISGVKHFIKKEIKNFKNSIDSLKESYEDLESVFFTLPNTPGFSDITKELSLIK